MNEPDQERLIQLLKSVIRPVADAELQRDLWPQMLRRMDEPRIRVPWFDWAAAGLVVLLLFLFPGVIPGVLYHL